MTKKPACKELEEKVKELEKEVARCKYAKETLRETKKRFSSLIQTAGSAIVLLSPERKILEFNNEAERIYGYKREDALGKDYVKLVFPEDDQTAQALVIDRILKGEPLRGFENTIRAQDGTERVMLWNATPCYDTAGRTMGCMGIGIDITKEKRVENALRESEKRLRHLSSELLNAQEKERKRISLELHDELGQSLTTLKLQLRAIQEKSNPSIPINDVEKDWIEVFSYLDKIINDTRRLSRGLSPVILEDLGLTSTLRWLIDNFSRRCGILCSIDMVDIDDFYKKKSQILIYRIFQESLANIAKHANATYVSVIVRDNGSNFNFWITDNGAGFDVDEIFTRNAMEKGMGLVAMEERINMLRGSLTIDSHIGIGTTVAFTLPINLTGGQYL